MSIKRKSRVGRPSTYPPEFRRDAVAMVLDEGRAIADVDKRNDAMGAWTVHLDLGIDRTLRRFRDDRATGRDEGTGGQWPR